jgi:hypothetical protein
MLVTPTSSAASRCIASNIRFLLCLYNGCFRDIAKHHLDNDRMNERKVHTYLERLYLA